MTGNRSCENDSFCVVKRKPSKVTKYTRLSKYCMLLCLQRILIVCFLNTRATISTVRECRKSWSGKRGVDGYNEYNVTLHTLWPTKS